ncbi:response regulator [Robbsia sp. Bb-Pol-6]|uniref:histidine kinase n=1 Tax=Robbsia betulipollinis TaxID=2981849 RepID=A0ABT3ZI96_9BURK|nr:response regulator [Robbsia betulipollinis]MCY0386245.1 response regulator [Robbsia betulipollinis]
MNPCSALLPDDEARRLDALSDLAIVDSAPELAFDDIVLLASQICQAPISVISLVDGERQWFKARVGLIVPQTPRQSAFCAHAILDPANVMVVEDTLRDPRFRDNPLVLGDPYIRFYAGAPIVTQDGHALGTVCVLDRVARTLDAAQIRALQALARQTAALLQLRRLGAAQQARTADLQRRVTEALADDQNAHAGLRQSQRVAAVGQLTSGIAHDFNNLLQTINVSLQLIERKADAPERVQRWAASALEAVSQGARLTAQLLSFSRSQAPERKPLPVDTALCGLTELLRRALGPEVHLILSLNAPDAAIMGDAIQFEAAVLNQAINARDAMGGVGRIDIRTRVVPLRGDATLADGDYLVLDICDNGPGMPASVVERAFEPFFTTKADGKGSGLGLAQVYGFAMRADGIARIRSQSGIGTTISSWLRITGIATGPTPSADTVRELATGRDAVTDGGGTDVLLVDDDPDVRALLGELMRDGGYRVRTASNARDALDAVVRAPPDIVLTDCAMRDVSGGELAHALRAQRVDLPIVFMTGHADRDAIVRNLGLGPDVVLLQKPLRLEDVSAGLARALARGAPPSR